MKLKLLTERLYGERLREAAATDFHDVITLVRSAVEVLYKRPDGDRRYVDIHMMSTTEVVVRLDGRYWLHTYTISDDNVVNVSSAVEVTRSFEPVTNPESDPAPAPVPVPGQVFLEAKNDAGTRWEIRVINAGVSLNQVDYPAALLRESVPQFANARVFVKSDAEHIRGAGKDFNNLIGKLVNPRFVEAAGNKPAGINADFELLASAGEIPAKLLESYERGLTDMFGFSIDATGVAKRRGALREAKSILKVNSVDLIIEPGAGGQVIKLIESVNSEENKDDDMLRERMIEAVKAAHGGKLPDGLDVDNETSLLEAYEATVAQKAKADSQAESDDSVKLVEARADARVKIVTSGLPDAARTKLLNDFAYRESIADGDVAEAIAQEREYLANFAESGKVGDGDFNDGRVTEDVADKRKTMLDDFFAGKGGVHSFKECYGQITGDWKVTGRVDACDQVRLRESLGAVSLREAITTAGFSDLLGDALNRRMVADYREQSVYDVWRNLVTAPVPLNDFRTQERVRYGGYGDLPAVAESGDYTALSTPDDEKATYAASKKGGIETITLESIKNDDVGLVRGVPLKMSRAAKRTLSKFVLDFLRTNPQIYDGTNLFTVAHGNLGSAALDAAAFAAARLAMKKQQEAGSDDRIGIGPSFLWVPDDLEQTAYDLFKRDTNNDANFVQSLMPTIVPVWYWDDASDWCASANPADIPTIEIGFMDGEEEPEMFVQDAPNVGSLFSNDRITYKIRHIYGGGVLDYRGLYKSVVA